MVALRKEQAKQARTEYLQEAIEQVQVLRNVHIALVPSRTRANPHEVKYDNFHRCPTHCTCTGWFYRGDCDHAEVTRLYFERERRYYDLIFSPNGF